MQRTTVSPAMSVPVQPVAERAAATNRLAYIDNLRVVLTILVIVLHSAVSYGSEGGWYYKEPTDDMAAIIPLTIIAAILQSFFMGLFFFLSGLFTPGSYDRKGAAKFMLDRVLRLGIPCLVFFYALNPLSEYIAGVWIEGIPIVYSAAIGTMWFAQALLLLGLVYALLRVVFRPAAITRRAVPLPSTWQFVALVVVMAAATFGVRYFYPRGTGMFGMIFGDFPQYLVMFGIGLAAYRNNWLDALDRVNVKRLAAALGVLIVLLPVMMLFGEDPVYGYEPFMGGIHWQAAAYATWESCMAVVMSLLLLKTFQNKLQAQSNLMADMASSAYTVYIIHPVFLVSISYLLLGLGVHPLVKFALLVVSGTVTTFAAANVIRRIPGARRIL